MNVVDRLLQLFAERGQGAYFGEAVTETEFVAVRLDGCDHARLPRWRLHD